MPNEINFLCTNNFRLANHTFLQGSIIESYQNLVHVFGRPLEGDGYKTDAEWIIQFDDGTIATIYNWKNGYSYCGPDGLPVESITDWNIGGHTSDAVLKVKEALSND